MARERKERVHGPYKHGNRWRVVVVGRSGLSSPHSFATEREAVGFVAEVRKQQDSRTWQVAVDAYLADLVAKRLASETVKRQRFHLTKLLELGKRGGSLLYTLTPKLARVLYDDLRTRAAVDTHRNALSVGKAFGRWCSDRGWLPADPFDKVKGIGRRKRGKPQPRTDEARVLLSRAYEFALEGDEGAVATMMALLLGLRASEIIWPDVRDLDDGGCVLHVPTSKTRAGLRRMAVPDILRPLLLRQVDGRDRTAPLFVNADGERRSRDWIHDNVIRVCLKAGVPKITPQGLRGAHSTLASSAHETPHVVAAALGHSSPAITQSAYIDRLVVQAEERRTVFATLLGTRTAPEVPTDDVTKMSRPN